MINPLFRTQFESNISAFIVFLALNAFMCFILIQIRINSAADQNSADTIIAIGSWLLAFCLLAGVIGLLRQNREKRIRLYALLPVSSLQVRVAYWYLASLFVFISTCVLILAMIFASSTPLANVPGFALLYFVHAGALLAVISIISSNNLRLIPEEIRKRSVIYFFMAAFLTFMILFAMGLLVAGYGHVLGGGQVNWTLLTVLMVFVCAGLVLLDVYLFTHKDNYLG